MAKSANKKSKKISPDSEVATGLRELMVSSLKDLYWAEQAITESLPVMIKNATSDELVTALTNHLEETQIHVQRLEEVFGLLNETAEARTCAAMEGILKEGNEIMENTVEGYVRDAGIIAAGQKVEHYEIASYGTVIAFAKTLGETESALILQHTLDEEKLADDKLSEIAELSVNIEAAGNEADDAPLEEVVETQEPEM